MSWLQQAKGIPVPHVATELGLILRRRALGPCPACGAELRGRRDRRGPIGPTNDGHGWKCHACERTGSGLDLVGLALELGPCSAEARAWWASRGWCTPAADAPPAPSVTPRPPPPPPATERPRLDPAAVAALWDRCTPAGEDLEVAGWLRSRALDVGLVDDRSLVRALPTAELPAWAAHWPYQGARAVLPLVDATGTLAGLRARQTRPSNRKGPKSSAMRGVRSAGLVLADGTAQALLRSEPWVQEVGPVRVLITEGEPDYLTWATQIGEAASAPAVLGIPGAGAWTAELAAQIPDGAVVYLLTHDDEAGRAYARKIGADLGHRCTVLGRRADG